MLSARHSRRQRKYQLIPTITHYFSPGVPGGREPGGNVFSQHLKPPTNITQYKRGGETYFLLLYFALKEREREIVVDLYVCRVPGMAGLAGGAGPVLRVRHRGGQPDLPGRGRAAPDLQMAGC